MKFALEMSKNMYQFLNQSKPFQLPPGSRNISHMNISPMFGASVSGIDLAEKPNNFNDSTYPTNNNNNNNPNNPNNPNSPSYPYNPNNPYNPYNPTK